MAPDDPFDVTAGLPPAVLAVAIAALQQPDDERDRAFAGLCTSHPELAPRLRQMVADFVGVERLLGDGFGDRADAPAQIGPYRVVRRLGGGAFGEVFLCEQTEPVRREVAVKVLRAAGDRTTMLRFAAERQLIASLQHPAIAQVFDAGTLADGRPFFVMDAIDGLPLDRYCDQHALSIEARLDLFCDLCRAVHHAHERGIVHRDLKPANILVIDVDGRPRPKVIDFGIAKVLPRSRVERSFGTEAGRVVGTPGYMSPEQQQGSSDDVDARSDVFCLGVVLYELLCGAMPWAAGAAATDTDPQRPSTRVSGSVAEATAVAQRRATEPRRLASRLRGDLDWIVLKCLQRDRAHRYQTVQQLVDDLERHRRAEPVQAGPPSAAYRARRYLRRHRFAATAVGSGALVAICGLLLALSYRRSTDAEIDAATKQAAASFADAAAAVARLVERANDPAVREAPQGDVVREGMLRDALSFYDRFLTERPTDPALRVKRCRVLLGLSHVHWLLGKAELATGSALAARPEAEALHTADPENVALRGLLGEALCRHGFARSLAGDNTAALASFTAAIDHLAAGAAADPAQFGRLHASALRSAATVLPPSQGEARLRGLRAAAQALVGLRSVEPAIPDLAYEDVLTACMLGQELRLANALPEAEGVLQVAEARLPQVATERLHLTCRVSTLRAQVSFQRGERQSTLVHYEAALAAATAWAAAQPERWLPRATRGRALRQLGYARNYVGDFDGSVDAFRQSIATFEALIERTPNDQARRDELADVLEEFALTLFDRFQKGVLAEAAACVDRAVALRQRAAPDAPPDAPRWTLLGLQAAIADARTAGGGDRYWPGVAAAVATDPKPTGRGKDAIVGVFCGLARWHLDHGRTAAAAASLQQAETRIAADPAFHARRTVEVGWLTARLAATAADHAACATAAERVLAARATWSGRIRAADCLHLAWRCAGDDANATAAATTYADRAAALYQQVIGSLAADVREHGDDPWFVLPWATACIRVAERTAAGGDAAGALALVAPALQRLDAVREQAHADQWDEGAYRDGRALQDKLAAAGR